jgi:flagellar basal body P-ring protein FlgI
MKPFLRIHGISLLGLILAGPSTTVLLGKDIEDPKTLKALRALEAQQDADDSADPDQYRTKIETKLVGDYTNFAGLTPIDVVGVGLVVGLHGTGGNPAPSKYRTALLEDLKRRNVRRPNEIMASPDTALVLVKAKLPPLMDKGDTIDVEVYIPDSAEAASLEGGWLMETFLTEQMIVPDKGPLLGHHYGRVQGPILLSTIGGDPEKAVALKRRGRVLGGGVISRERELAIYLRNDFRSIRNAIRIARAVSSRFHDYDKYGLQKPMAEAKNDQKIVLSVHPKYKNNFPRYLQVIRHVAFNENPTARRLRIQRLKSELQTPETSEEAALQLEAIGRDAIPVLRSGVQAPLLECRFHAASALAYLGESDADSIGALAEAARQERAFRVFALAALSVVEDAEAHLALRDLMNEESMETRYGAFRALWVLDKNDPFIRGEPVQVLEGKTGYMLHELDTRGEPLVHLTMRTRPEIVLFGADQKFNAPLYLTAGKQIMVTAQPGAQSVSVVKFTPDQPDQRREVSLRVSDVIRAVSELDATYPDVVQLLTEAAKQHNFEGRFAHDALPEGGRMYERPASGEGPKGSRKARIGRDNLTPNLFPLDPSQEEDAEDQPQEPALKDPGMASVVEKDGEPNTETRSLLKTEMDEEFESRTKRPSFWPKWLTPRVHRFEQEDDESEPSRTDGKSPS